MAHKQAEHEAAAKAPGADDGGDDDGDDGDDSDEGGGVGPSTWTVSSTTFWTLTTIILVGIVLLLVRLGQQGFFDKEAVGRCQEHWFWLVNQWTTCKDVTEPLTVAAFKDGFLLGAFAMLQWFVWGPNPITKRLAGLRLTGSVLASIAAPVVFYLIAYVAFPLPQVARYVALNEPLAWLGAFLVGCLVFVIGMFQKAD